MIKTERKIITRKDIREEEKQVLMGMIEFPEFIPMLRKEISEEDIDKSFRGILTEIYRLYDEDGYISAVTLAENLEENFSISFLADSISLLVGRKDKGRCFEYLLSHIGKIRKARACEKLGVEIYTEIYDGRNIDLQKVRDLANSGLYIGSETEDSSIENAVKEYRDWKDLKPTGISIGIDTFDHQTDDINYGEVVTYIGRAATGKTFLALHSIKNILNKSQESIGFFSLEMAKSTIVERLMQSFYTRTRYGVNEGIKNGELNETAFEITYKKLHVFSQIYSVDQIRMITEKAGFKVVFIDYLQLLKQDEGRNLYEKATYSMREIKEFAKNSDVAVFLLSQVSRRGGDGSEPVTMDMARGSGEIEEHSDFMVGIWNPSLRYAPDDPSDEAKEFLGKRSLKLLKNKRGPIDSLKVKFSEETGVFEWA